MVKSGTRRKPPPGMEYWISDTHQLILVHEKSRCTGHCSIHVPATHHMKDWHRHWRDDRKFMERLCPDHGVGHPDPQQMDFIRAIRGDRAAYEGIHGCCGCCAQIKL